MEKILLSDPNVFPSSEILSKVLGEKIDLYDKALEIIKIEIPESDPQWNYYKDGKSWLLKVVHSKKTLCWIFVFEKGIKTTFYINGKYEEYIIESNLPEELKEEYLGTKEKKIRGISLKVEKEKDLTILKELVKIKKRAK